MSQTRFYLKFHNTKDADIIATLQSKDNMQDYIRGLIRADAIISQMIATDPMLAIEDHIEEMEAEHGKEDKATNS